MPKSTTQPEPAGPRWRFALLFVLIVLYGLWVMALERIRAKEVTRR